MDINTIARMTDISSVKPSPPIMIPTLPAAASEMNPTADGTLASIPPITRDEAYEIYKLAL